MTDTAPLTVKEPSAIDQEVLEANRREQFAHAVAFGVPIPHALRQAGYENSTPGLGWSLLRQQEVVNIIDADRTWLREKIKISQEQIIAYLEHDRAFAYICENPGAAISATMSIAKVVGIADPAGMKGSAKSGRLIIEWNEGEPELVPEMKVING